MSEDKKSAPMRIEKICHDSDCAEKIAALSQEQADLCKTFVYCPYCAEELALVCPSCRETLQSGEFKFCPWCGQNFE